MNQIRFSLSPMQLKQMEKIRLGEEIGQKGGDSRKQPTTNFKASKEMEEIHKNHVRVGRKTNTKLQTTAFHQSCSWISLICSGWRGGSVQYSRQYSAAGQVLVVEHLRYSWQLEAVLSLPQPQGSRRRSNNPAAPARGTHQPLFR